MSGIYVASKTKHAKYWLELRKMGWPIVSTWIDEAGPGESKSLSDLWERNVREAATARALLFYMEPYETAKGALVELGSALASGVPVFWVGEAVGTVVNHRLVRRCESTEHALALMMRELGIKPK